MLSMPIIHSLDFVLCSNYHIESCTYTPLFNSHRPFPVRQLEARSLLEYLKTYGCLQMDITDLGATGSCLSSQRRNSLMFPSKLSLQANLPEEGPRTQEICSPGAVWNWSEKEIHCLQPWATLGCHNNAFLLLARTTRATWGSKQKKTLHYIWTSLAKGNRFICTGCHFFQWQEGRKFTRLD